MYLKIIGANDKQNKVIDSINYSKSFRNAKGVVDETNLFSSKLEKLGFLEQQILESGKKNDSTFLYSYDIGKKTNFIHIYIGENFSGEMENLFDTKSDTLKLPFQESESFLNAIVKKLEVKGFSMAKVKLVNVKNKDGFVTADLNIAAEQKRQLNDNTHRP